MELSLLACVANAESTGQLSRAVESILKTFYFDMSFLVNLNCLLVKQLLICALKRHSKFEQRTADMLVLLTLFCLNSVITQHGQNYYTQTNGIVTGDNYSVSVANVEEYYIISKIAGELK